MIEFAFVFLPLLLLTLGTLFYGLVFVSQQAFAFAAQRGADAMVQVDPESFRDNDGNVNVASYCDAGKGLAVQRVQDLMPDVPLLSVCPDTEGKSCSVQAITSGRQGCEFRISKQFPLKLPLLPLPDTLHGEGFVPIS